MKVMNILLLLLVSGRATAGVMPSHSRVVYHDQDKEQTLMLANTNPYPVIVQTWVDHGEGTPDSQNIPFISLPPLLKIEPYGIKGVRIIYNHTTLPRDKESLFWFNIYEIPPEKIAPPPENSVLVTMNTQIKLFFRPSGITIPPEEAIKQLSCKQTAATLLTCSNPSQVYISIIAVSLNSPGKNVKAKDVDMVMSPYSQKTFQFNRVISTPKEIEFVYINDFGEQLTYKSTRFYTQKI